MYIKLTKLHLVGIVILSLLLGSLGILGAKEAYENLNDSKKKNDDYLCSAVAKKVSRDTELKHYASTNDMEATRKRLQNPDKKSDVELAASTANSAYPDFITPEELDCMGKIARNLGGEYYNQFQKSILMYEAIMADPTVEKKEKLKFVDLIRKDMQEKGCFPPKGKMTSGVNASSSSNGPTHNPDYQCLKKNNKATHSHSLSDPINEERVGFSSPENQHRRGHHQHSGEKIKRRRNLHRGQHTHRRDIPDGQEDLYILKSQMVPPVCPKCPDMPSLTNICSKCGKGKKEEVEDELINNNIEKEKKSSSRAARRREKRKRTYQDSPAQNAPGVREAANRNEPNQSAFAPQANVPIPRLNSFSSFA